MRRITIVAYILLAWILAVPGSAQAESYVDQAVAALQHSTVFVAEGTEQTDQNTTGILQSQLTSSDHIATVMLPASAMPGAGSSAYDVAQVIDNATGHQYILVVSIGSEIGTATQLLPAGVAADQLVRAQSVSTSTMESIGTFIRNIHSWQRAHPEDAIKPASSAGKTKQNKDGISWATTTLIAVVTMLIISVVSTLFRRRRSSTPADDSLSKVKLTVPKRIRDELDQIMSRRQNIADSSLREIITQMIRDTNEVFNRLSADAPDQISLQAVEFEKHLQMLIEVIDEYVNAQEKPRYYVNATEALQDGRESIKDYAEYVLNSARRAGRERLTQYNVNNKILSAQKYT